MRTLAVSCLKRPSDVCFLGVEVGSWGSTSTTQPKRLTSLGSCARSNRGSTASHRRPAESSALTLYRPRRGSRGSSVIGADVPKYWLKFSDRKSTRLNSSHANISYAVFCLKKKKNRGVLPDHGVKTLGRAGMRQPALCRGTLPPLMVRVQRRLPTPTVRFRAVRHILAHGLF